MPDIAVIIPTLNEADTLVETLAEPRSASTRPCEVIVTDCNSTDRTPERAAARGAGVVYGSHSRSQAMNRGAARASPATDVLLFLHASRLIEHTAASETSPTGRCLLTDSPIAAPRPADERARLSPAYTAP